MIRRHRGHGWPVTKTSKAIAGDFARLPARALPGGRDHRSYARAGTALIAAKARARNGTLFARQWSASTCARAARVFWQIVQTEGLDWISDIEVRRVAESRATEHLPQTAQP